MPATATKTATKAGPVPSDPVIGTLSKSELSTLVTLDQQLEGLDALAARRTRDTTKAFQEVARGKFLEDGDEGALVDAAEVTARLDYHERFAAAYSGLIRARRSTLFNKDVLDLLRDVLLRARKTALESAAEIESRETEEARRLGVASSPGPMFMALKRRIERVDQIIGTDRSTAPASVQEEQRPRTQVIQWLANLGIGS